MKEYDHHDPDCNFDGWLEEAVCESEYFEDYE